MRFQEKGLCKQKLKMSKRGPGQYPHMGTPLNTVPGVYHFYDLYSYSQNNLDFITPPGNLIDMSPDYVLIEIKENISILFFFSVLGIEPRALCLQGKHSTDWAISPAISLFLQYNAIISYIYLYFFLQCWGSNPGPCACKASTLPTKLSPQS